MNKLRGKSVRAVYGHLAPRVWSPSVGYQHREGANEGAHIVKARDPAGPAFPDLNTSYFVDRFFLLNPVLMHPNLERFPNPNTSSLGVYERWKKFCGLREDLRNKRRGGPFESEGIGIPDPPPIPLRHSPIYPSAPPWGWATVRV